LFFGVWGGVGGGGGGAPPPPGTALPSLVIVIASPFFKKGEAISYWVSYNPIEIASLRSQ